MYLLYSPYLDRHRRMDGYDGWGNTYSVHTAQSTWYRQSVEWAALVEYDVHTFRNSIVTDRIDLV